MGMGGREPSVQTTNAQTANASIAALLQGDMANIQALRQELPRLVWQSAGICREGSVMATAIAQIQSWQEAFANLAISQALLHLQPEEVIETAVIDTHTQLRVWAETRNLLDVAGLILQSAHSFAPRVVVGTTGLTTLQQSPLGRHTRLLARTTKPLKTPPVGVRHLSSINQNNTARLRLPAVGSRQRPYSRSSVSVSMSRSICCCAGSRTGHTRVSSRQQKRTGQTRLPVPIPLIQSAT